MGWVGFIGFLRCLMFEFWKHTWKFFYFFLFFTFVFCSTSGKAICEGNAHTTTCPPKRMVWWCIMWLNFNNRNEKNLGKSFELAKATHFSYLHIFRVSPQFVSQGHSNDILPLATIGNTHCAHRPHTLVGIRNLSPIRKFVSPCYYVVPYWAFRTLVHKLDGQDVTIDWLWCFDGEEQEGEELHYKGG